MSTYVMSDIHGCYKELIEMLNIIEISQEDRIIFAGDYIDRGNENYEVLNWLKEKQTDTRYVFLLGNHDVDFIKYINTIESTRKEMNTDNISKIMCRVYEKDAFWNHFDQYSTIEKLILENHITYTELIGYRDLLRTFSYVYKTSINDKDVIIVHAGYISKDEFVCSSKYKNIEDYYIWARDDVYNKNKGYKNTIIIAGHTPTDIRGEKVYTGGKVYRQYNKKLNCLLYNIDCGCVYAYGDYKESSLCNLACLRVEDEKIFYVKPNKKRDKL